MQNVLEISGRATDFGDIAVRRLLPVPQKRAVGPFIFVDHFGPLQLPPGHGMDVRPHPHIGLATVTYLFEGEILHRDSLGSVQLIQPGAVNLMVAGRGIVHSERTEAAERARGARLHGLQSWLALPAADEECEPRFYHHPVESLPRMEREGLRVRVILGEAFGQRSPVVAAGGPLLVEMLLAPGASVSVREGALERALYPIENPIRLDGIPYPPRRLLVLPPGPCRLDAPAGGTVMLLGGKAMPEPPHVWWNFASSSPERIEAAKRDWLAQRFPRVPGETEFTPLPDVDQRVHRLRSRHSSVRTT